MNKQTIISIILSIVGIGLIIGFGVIAVNNSKEGVDMGEPINDIVTLVVGVILLILLIFAVFIIRRYGFRLVPKEEVLKWNQ